MHQESIQNINFKSSDGLEQVGRIWNFSTNIYTQSANIIVERSCFGFMFTNLGDVVATINGMVIFPSTTPTTAIGDSRSVMAHLLDIYKGNLTLSFENPTVGVTPRVEVVQLFYAASYR